MKRKVLILTIVLSLLFAGIVSAASLWGTYKGNNIIMIAIDGKPVKTGDVPAISYNGRTMIPIYLLSQAGINYTWNQQTKTVDIKGADNNFAEINSAIISKQYEDFFQIIESCNARAEVYAVGLLNANPINKTDLNSCKERLHDFLSIVDGGLHNPELPVIDRADLEQFSVSANKLIDKYDEQIDKLFNSDIQGAELLFGEISSEGDAELGKANSYYYNLMISIQSGTASTLESYYEPEEPAPSDYPIIDTSPSTVINTRIDGDFDGFEYDKVFILQNGQIWKQTSFELKLSLKLSPKVTIFKDGVYYYMIVDGVDKKVKVEQIK